MATPLRVAVLGAGLQGACVALELAARGVSVDLYDKNIQPMTQASLLNEAKIHLGFFYGNDPTLNTARRILDGALTFAPLLRRWLGDDIDKIPVSQPYLYAVHKDSLLTADEIERHLQRTSALAGEMAPLSVDYFGINPRERPSRLDCFDQVFDPSMVVAAFQTPEVGISAESLAQVVRGRLRNEANVRCVMGAAVLTATPLESWARVEFELGGARHTEGYDHVINALWDGRLKIDATAGILPERPWLFRTKYNVHVPNAALHTLVPSVSVVLGTFGDLVQYSNGEMYLSWYPAGLKDVTSELAPPDFASALAGEEAERIRNETFNALRAIVPGLAELAPACLERSEVKGGVIFAWGETDISDPRSELHTRFDVGPRSYGRYHSIDTGKLTTAPLFAKLMADRLLGE